MAKKTDYAKLLKPGVKFFRPGYAVVYEVTHTATSTWTRLKRDDEQNERFVKTAKLVTCLKSGEMEIYVEPVKCLDREVKLSHVHFPMPQEPRMPRDGSVQTLLKSLSAEATRFAREQRKAVARVKARLAKYKGKYTEYRCEVLEYHDRYDVVVYGIRKETEKEARKRERAEERAAAVQAREVEGIVDKLRGGKVSAQTLGHILILLDTDSPKMAVLKSEF